MTEAQQSLLTICRSISQALSLKEWEKDLASVATESAANILSNSILMCNTTIDFLTNDPRSDFFPDAAINELFAPLNQAEPQINAYRTNNNVTNLNNALPQLDQAYAVAIRYGIITFGFTAKEANEQVEQLRSINRKANKSARDAEKKLHDIISSLEQQKEEALNQSQNMISSCHKEIGTIQNENQEIITSLKEEVGTLKNSYEAAVLTTEETTTKSSSLNDTLETIEEEAKARLQEIVDSQGQANTSADSCEESSRQSQAELSSTKDARASLEQEFKEVSEFSADIESYRATLTKNKKAVDVKISELNEKYDEKFTTLNEEYVTKYNKDILEYDGLKEQLGNETDVIIDRNKELQEEIKGHLQKATGIGLFSVFNMRKTSIFWWKWIWLAIVIGALYMGYELSLHISSALSDDQKVDAAFFLKLSAAIPIAFITAFAAKQFSHEKHAEEEYAFKSAISLSLEPYKDLLVRMKNEKHEGQTHFVEKLLSEIFDNPVKRIYKTSVTEKKPKEAKLNLAEIKDLIAVIKELDPVLAKKVLPKLISKLGIDDIIS